jgi:PAS domain S-box-containing protein
LKKRDVIGRKATEVVPFIEKPLVERLCQVALTGNDERFEAFLPYLNRWYDITAYSPQRGYFTALFNDITERKKAEEALRESERNLSEGQRIARMGSWQWDIEKDETIWSKELYRIYGFEPRPIAPKIQEFFNIVHPEDRPFIVKDAERLVKSGGPSSVDFRVQTRDGTIRWVHAENGATAFDESGKPLRVGGTVQDVTERKMAAEALEAAKDEAEHEKQRMEAMMEALPVGVVIMDQRGGIVRYNNTFRKLWSGRYKGNLPPVRSVNDYVLYQAWWPDSGRPVRPEEWGAARALKRGEGVVAQMLEIRRFDGTNGFIIHNAAPIIDSSGKIIGAAVAIQDITELRQTQDALRENEARYRLLSRSLKRTVKAQVEQLRQAEYLASLGRMVAIMAHEIRNPLLNIQLGMDLLSSKVERDKEACEIMSDVQQGVNLLSDTVNELLEYARTVRVELELLPIAEIIGQALKALSNKLQNISVDLELENEKRELFVDAPKMARALLNIILNAAEAMPEGGKLRITSTLSSSRRLLLTISDTGYGMDRDALDRLFTPFYTTKITGTGLGLSISRKIIEAHEGKMTIKSKPKEGTTVKISLPLPPK